MPLFLTAPLHVQQPPPATPPTGQDAFYFKSDNLPYYMGPDGVEHPFIVAAPSLHLNPTFDLTVTGPRPANWDSTTWLTSPATAASDSGVGNVVSGSSLKFTGTAQNGWGWVTEGNTHGVYDQQQIKFGCWAKTSVPTTAVPTLHLMQMTNTTSAGCAFGQAGLVQTDRILVIDSTWRYYEVTFPVPPGHLFGRFCIGVNEAGTPLAAGAVWVDETVSSAIQAPATTWGVQTCLSAATGQISTSTFDVVGGWDLGGASGLYTASTSAGASTFDVPGMFMFNASVTIAGSNVACRRIIVIQKNGTEQRRFETYHNPSGSAPQTLQVSHIMPMNIGDTFAVATWQNSGGPLNYAAVPGHVWQAWKISENLSYG